MKLTHNLPRVTFATMDQPFTKRPITWAGPSRDSVPNLPTFKPRTANAPWWFAKRRECGWKGAIIPSEASHEADEN